MERVNQVEVSDIPCIPTMEGWLYLAAFMDLKSRKIKGWTIRDHMRTKLVETAFRQAVCREGPVPCLIAHSDRGSQYASMAFRQLLERHQVSAACRPREARLAIFDHIEVFYNRHRIHGAVGDVSPLDCELKFAAQIP